jgi:hypothetical protein
LRHGCSRPDFGSADIAEGTIAMTEPPQQAEAAALAARALAAFQHGGTERAVSLLADHADPDVAGRAFAKLGQMLYRDHKDVSAMIRVGEAGLAYCLDRAAEDPVQAAALRRQGQIIAFNSAANCWPGWGDAGIAIDSAQLAAGTRLAAASAALVAELKLPELAQGNVQWLIGALDFAAGRHAAALVAEDRAAALFRAGNHGACALLAEGYAALIRKADPALRDDGAAELARVLAALRAEGSDDAHFFAEQLVTAERILLPSDGG